MNNILDFRRLCNLMSMDLRRMSASSLNTFVVLAGVYVFFTLFSIFVNTSMVPTERISIFLLVSTLFMIMLPRIVYGKVNDRREGIAYGMLPVSTTEKFISMVLTVSVVAPILFYAVVFSIDTLLVFLSPEGSGASGYLWSDGALDLKSTLRTFASLSLVQSAFILGNLCFKSRKVTKTLLILLGVHLLLVFVFVVLGYKYVVPEWFQAEDEAALTDQVMHITSGLSTVVEILYSAVLPVGLLLLSYLKLKKLQYK